MDPVDVSPLTSIRGTAGDPQVDPDAPAPNLPPDRFLDRELSWLAFNNRVLDLAKDRPRVPVLERAKFLAIFASNLDEFYMVRVAGLKRRIATGIAVRAASGFEPREILHEISHRTGQLMARHARTYRDVIEPAMAEHGIFDEGRLRTVICDRITAWDLADEPSLRMFTNA